MSRKQSSMTAKQAKGVANGDQMQLVCRFDIETWQQIRGLAASKKISVAEMVRRLCEIGLEEIANAKN